MKSTTSLVATQYRLQQWAAQIQDCQNRPAGMKVDDWCAQNNIKTANYYYRLRQVREACIESVSQEIVPVPLGLLTSETKDQTGEGLDLLIHGISIHVTEHTSSNLLSSVLKVIADAQ